MEKHGLNPDWMETAPNIVSARTYRQGRAVISP